MKRRLFKQGENIPKWLLNATPMCKSARCMFGVDMELVINNRGYLLFPLDELKENEYLVIVEYNKIESGSKQVFIFSKPKKRVKKKERRKSYTVKI